MNLVFVHGRAQEGKDPVQLQKDWMDALAYGMARANVTLPAGTAVKFPYYGDTLKKMVDQVNAPLGLQINPKGPNPDSEAELRGEMILEIAEAAGIDDADIRNELGNEPFPKGPENWGWVQAALRTLDRIEGVNSGFVDRFTRDVYVYLTNGNVRLAIDGIVNKEIDQDACVVVAHSLGTVVAHNVLAARTATSVIPKLITIGSPLGIRGIKRKLDKPIRHPANVTGWFNAYDERDVVALVPLDAANFNVTPAIVNKNDVQNFTDNRHGISGYLSDPVVAATIVKALRSA